MTKRLLSILCGVLLAGTAWGQGHIGASEIKPCPEGQIQKTVGGVVICANDENDASDKGRILFVKEGGEFTDTCGTPSSHCGDPAQGIANVDDADGTDELNYYIVQVSSGNWDPFTSNEMKFRCTTDFKTDCETTGTPDVTKCPTVASVADAGAENYLTRECYAGYKLAPQCSHGANDGTLCVRQCDPTIYDGGDLPLRGCFHDRHCPQAGTCSGGSEPGSDCVTDNDCAGAGDCTGHAVINCVDGDFYNICDEDPGNADGITNTCKSRHAVVVRGENVRLLGQTSRTDGIPFDFSNSVRTGFSGLSHVGAGNFASVCGSLGGWRQPETESGGCNSARDSDEIDRGVLFGLYGSGNSTIGFRTHPFLFNAGKSTDAAAVYIETYRGTFDTQEGFLASYGCDFAGLCDDDNNGSPDTPNILCRTDTESPCTGTCIPMRCNSSDIEMDSLRMQTPGYGFVVTNGPGYCTSTSGDHDNMERCWKDSGTGSCTVGTSPTCVENRGANFNVASYSMQLVQIGNDTDESDSDNETHAQTGTVLTDHAAVLSRCFGDVADADCLVSFEIKGGSIGDLVKEGGGAPERSLWADHGGDIVWAFMDWDTSKQLKQNSGTITWEGQTTGTGYIISLPIQLASSGDLSPLCTGADAPFHCCTGAGAGCSGGPAGLCRDGSHCLNDADCTGECSRISGAWHFYDDGPDMGTSVGFPAGPDFASEQPAFLFAPTADEYVHTSFVIPDGYAGTKMNVLVVYRTAATSTSVDQCYCASMRDFPSGDGNWFAGPEEDICASTVNAGQNLWNQVVIPMTSTTYAAGNHVKLTVWRDGDASETECSGLDTDNGFAGRVVAIGVQAE